MGTWNAGLFSNDTTLDVKDTYMKCLEQQLSNEEAYKKTYEEYEELIGTDEEPLFWYALADTQWNVGRLMPAVKEIALNLIAEKGGVSLWEDTPKKILKWENTLHKLKEKLESPMPPEKIIKKPIEFVTNPWNVGDVYAYQFLEPIAEEKGVYGKYIMFQKIGDIVSYEQKQFSIIQVYDKIFDEIPSLEELVNVRILPLIMPPRINGSPEKYIYPIEEFTKAIMVYYKRLDYPKKNFTYVGTQEIIAKEYTYNYHNEFLWGKRRMEDWLIKFHSSWQGIEY